MIDVLEFYSLLLSTLFSLYCNSTTIRICYVLKDGVIDGWTPEYRHIGDLSTLSAQCGQPENASDSTAMYARCTYSLMQVTRMSVS